MNSRTAPSASIGASTTAGTLIGSPPSWRTIAAVSAASLDSSSSTRAPPKLGGVARSFTRVPAMRSPPAVTLTRCVASRPHSRPGASPVRKSNTNPCIGQITECPPTSPSASGPPRCGHSRARREDFAASAAEHRDVLAVDPIDPRLAEWNPVNRTKLMQACADVHTTALRRWSAPAWVWNCSGCTGALPSCHGSTNASTAACTAASSSAQMPSASSISSRLR